MHQERLSTRARVDPHGRSQRRAGIARRGLHPHATEGTLVAQAGVHRAIQRHAARQAQRIASGAGVQPAMQPPGECQHRLLQGCL